MERIYEAALREHMRQYRQMAFLAGPRQVGKTTSCLNFAKNPAYYTWDNQAHRLLITSGPDAIADNLQLQQLRENAVTVLFDEIHKYPKWKTFLKGFFDVYERKTKIVVTGSSRLDLYKRGGDSLMGRYFLYRMHPLSVAELVRRRLSEKEIAPPRKIADASLNDLLQFGGFPEPFLKASTRFANRWRRLREQQLFREDVRDLTRVQEIGQIQVLAELVRRQSRQLTNYSNLARKVNVSVGTVRRWLSALESLYYCFSIRPWSRNVSKSLRKTTKIYLRDWSLVDDYGAKLETFVAAHLLKAVQWWEDLGLGDYGLFYLRDKQKREVDFLVTRNHQPWFLVEVKASGRKHLSKSLIHFQKQTQSPHAFQVAFDMKFVATDCFQFGEPMIVPAATLLSQLV